MISLILLYQNWDHGLDASLESVPRQIPDPWKQGESNWTTDLSPINDGLPS